MIASPEVDPALDDNPQADPASAPATALAPALSPQVGIPPTAVPATWEDVVRHEATKQKVSPKLALAIMQTESGGKPAARSPAGALGPMQLMPETAKRLGVDPTDPMQNIRGGVAELRRLIDQHGGDVEQVLRGYNGSPTASKEATDPYVRTVLGRLGVSSSTAPAAPTEQKSNGPIHVDSTSVAAPPPPAVKAKSTTTDLGEVFQGAPLRAGWDFAKSAVAGFDPREQQGRRNLAAGAGALTAGLMSGGSSLVASAGVGIAPAVYAALGAGIGGGLATSAERAVTGKGEPNDDLIEAGKQGATNLIGSGFGWVLHGAGRLAVRGAVSRNAAKSLSAEAQAVHDGLDAGSEAYRSLLAKDPSARAAGKAAAAVREGPAKSTKDQIGQAVEEAAASGPALKLEGSKAKAQAIFDKQIKDAEQYFSGKAAPEGEPALAGVGGDGAALLRSILSSGVSEEQKGAITAQLIQAGMPQDVAEATIEGARHPAAGVLRRIVNAPDEVPFAAAHQLKRQLGEAVDWEHPAKKQVQQITKGVFGSLRSDMAAAGHTPYEEATSQYASVVPLFNKGFGKQILKDATEEPGRFVGRISPAKPEQVKMLRELLVDLPAQQGEGAAAAGLKAWNGIRSAWTYDKVIKGGIDKMDQRLGKLTPDFVQEFYGDPEGKAILSNLQHMHAAWKSTTQAATDQQTRFLESTLAPKRVRQPDEVLMDVLRATALGSHSAWGALASARLLLGGAGAADLVEWASRSPKATQAMVTAFTSPAPGWVVANLYRMYTGQEAPSPVTPPPDGRFLGDGRSGGNGGGRAPQDGSGAATTIGQPPPR